MVTFHAAPNTSRSTIILLEFLLLQYNLTLNRKNTFFIKPFLPQHWCNRKYVQNSYLTVSWRRYLDWFLYDKDLCHETFNPIMPGVHKIVRHTLKILQNLLKDFKSVFHLFMDTRHDRATMLLQCLKIQSHFSLDVISTFLHELLRSFPMIIVYFVPLKLVSAIFSQIFIFHQMIALQKPWKMFFISSKKLFSFSSYSSFCIFIFRSYSPCQPSL